MRPSTSLFALLGLLSSTLASPVDERAIRLQPPSRDTFYAAPANVASLQPGTVVRSRPVPKEVQSTGGQKLNYKSAFQIVYRTTSNSGEAEVALTTILVPNNGDATKLLSYQVAEDAAFVDCAPSYGMQDGASVQAAVGTKGEMNFVQQALEKGWFVAVPDYEGPKATFLANKGAGQRVLDGIRAVLAARSISGIAAKPSIALWGYSGGSLASGFAAEIQSSYAPELTLAGAALGGTVPNILTVLYSVNKSPYAGLIPAGILGLAAAYPELADYVNENIKPAKNASFRRAETKCLTANIPLYAFQDVYTYTKSPDVFTSPLATRIVNENQQGNGTPLTPIYIYKGAQDQISPINDTEILYKSYCSRGSSVDYRVYPAGTHVGLLATGVDGALAWLTARLSGVAQTGCKKSFLG